MNGTLLTGATVWTGPNCQPRPGWLLVSGETIEAAGTAAQPPPAAGRVLDLQGKHVLPGFVDAHQHPTLTAWLPQGTDGIGWPDLPTALAAIRTAAVANASSPWLVFWNALPHTWPQRRLPTTGELDRVAPGRRVLVSVRDLHRAAVSPVVLAELGLDAASSWRRSDVVRDRRGRPTGELWEHACGAAVALALAQTEQHLGAQQVEAALRAELDRRLGYGYTHVHDAYVPPQQHQRMARLAEGVAPRLSWAIGSRAGIFAPGAGRAEFPAGRYGAASGEAKLFLDGGERCALRLPLAALGGLVLGAFRESAAVRGCGPLREAAGRRVHVGGEGLTLRYLRYDDRALVDVLAGYAQAGLRVRLHAVGNLAVRQAAKALRTAGVPAGTATVDHLALLDPATADALAASGAWACYQPGFLSSFGRTLLAAGIDRHAAVFGGRLLRDAGLRLVLSSDHPGGVLDPLQILRLAVSRRLADGTVIQPEQGISCPDAVRGLTTEAAASLDAPGAGGLAPGQPADLVVCDGDPFQPGTVVTQTWIGGRVAWSAEGCLGGQVEL